MKKKLVIIGSLMLFPTWIFILTPTAIQIIRTHNKFPIVLCSVIIMIIGAIVAMVGVLKEDLDK